MIMFKKMTQQAVRAGQASMLILFVVLFVGCSAAKPATVTEPAAGTTAVEEAYGIEVVSLRTSAASHMLDFRFRVIDPEKAMMFFREDIKPYLIDAETGKSLTVPVPAKLGPMRPTGRNPKAGVTYWMFFGNSGLVKSGGKVTIVIGDYRIENLVVE